MSIGPWIARSTSSSIKASSSSHWRSLIAPYNAREKPQRLCSVMMSFPETGLITQQTALLGISGDAVPGCCI